MGELTWKTLDIWIPGVRFTGIIGTRLRGRSSKSCLSWLKWLRVALNVRHTTKNTTSGEHRVGVSAGGEKCLKTSRQLFEEFSGMWIKGLPITSLDILDRTYYVWSIVPLSTDLHFFHLQRGLIWDFVECAAKCTMNRPFLKIIHLNISQSVWEREHSLGVFFFFFFAGVRLCL